MALEDRPRVYLAHDPVLDRELALKVKKHKDHEAKSLAQIYSDYIVEVYSEFIDQQDDLYVIAMEYVNGPNLREVLDRIAGEPLAEIISSSTSGKSIFSLEQARDFEVIRENSSAQNISAIIRSIALGLGAIHKHGQLHLDVKPENILLTHHGRAKILDFNISADKSQPLIKGGTRNYMAPEHEVYLKNNSEKKEVLDERADIYSLGVIISEFANLGFNKFQKIARLMTVHKREKRLEKLEDLHPLLNKIENDLFNEGLFKKKSWLSSWLNRNLKLGLLLYLFVPQIIASVFNISYNNLWVLSSFSEGRLENFYDLVFMYNIVVYPVCGVLIGLYFNTLFKTKTVEVAKISRILLLIGAVGWLPGAVIFPYFLNASPMVYLHFVFSFISSALIAVSYSFLFTHYFCARYLFPRIKADVIVDREKFFCSLDIFRMISGMLPFLALIIVSMSVQKMSQSSDLIIFQTVLIIFTFAGLVGFVSSTNTLEKVKKIRF